MRKLNFPLVSLLIIIGVTTFVLIRTQIQWSRTVALVPPSVAVPSVSATPLPTTSISPQPTVVAASPTGLSTPKFTQTKTVAASAIYLSVPFTVQAPDADWSEPWKEGCEEAALLMVEAYLKGDRAATLPVGETKAKINAMVDWQHEKFGGHHDLGLADIVTIAKDYMGSKTARIKENATFDDIRNELRAGHPVILPLAGQKLKNPYFKQPGPPYHVFVITGFEGKDFISNENGTKRGHDYKYSQTILENAWHDYVKGQPIESGPRSYLVLE